LVQASPKARIVNAAVKITLLGCLDGALKPAPGGREISGACQAVANLVQAFAEAFVIDATVNAAILGSYDGALEPRPGSCEPADLHQPSANGFPVLD
jgi:hypothetical protein